MKRSLIVFAVVATIGVSGCTGSAHPNASGSPQAAQTLAKVRLPDDPSALADLTTRQIRQMTSVRMTATSKLGGNDAGTITASLGHSGDLPAASLRLEDASTGTLKVIQGMMIGSTFYMRDLNSDAAPGKPWLRLSTSELGDPRLRDVSKFFRSAISQLAGAVKQATGTSDMASIKPGRLTARPADDTLGGVHVRRYEGTTRLAKLAGDHDAQDQKLLGYLQKAGMTSFPWKLWVDQTGLPRKFSVSLKIGKRGTFQADAAYANWGAPVDVKAPPANQTTGLADVGRK